MLNYYCNLKIENFIKIQHQIHKIVVILLIKKIMVYYNNLKQNKDNLYNHITNLIEKFKILIIINKKVKVKIFLL